MTTRADLPGNGDPTELFLPQSLLFDGYTTGSWLLAKVLYVEFRTIPTMWQSSVPVNGHDVTRDVHSHFATSSYTFDHDYVVHWNSSSSHIELCLPAITGKRSHRRLLLEMLERESEERMHRRNAFTTRRKVASTATCRRVHFYFGN